MPRVLEAKEPWLIGFETEPWLIDFVKEPVTDDRWSCIVTAAVETKVDDEECLKILGQFLKKEKLPLVQLITMADMLKTFKSEKASTDKKARSRDESGTELTNLEPPKPRFPEVASLIAKSIDTPSKMTPCLIAYAVKHMILTLKDSDSFQRKVRNAIRRKKRQSEIKSKLIRKLKGVEENKRSGSGAGSTETENKKWRRENFDIFGEKILQSGPYNGPQVFIVLSEFYDPNYFSEMRKINVPFLGLIRIEDFSYQMAKPMGSSSPKKSESINNFWSILESEVNERETTVKYKDMALLKYVAPPFDGMDPDEVTGIMSYDLIAILFTLFNLHRLHQMYIHQMKVHRMIESLEPFDLTNCRVYNGLCDTLVTEDSNAELLVLYAMVEEVAAGSIETKQQVSEYVYEDSDFFLPSTYSSSSTETIDSDAGKAECAVSDCEHPQKTQLLTKCHMVQSYLIDSRYGKGDKPRKNDLDRRKPVVFLYDDLISLRTFTIDPNIVKAKSLFKRFIINSVLSKIWSKYPKLTAAERALSDFQFFRIWERSKDKEEDFKIKMYFSIVMRLMACTKVFDGGCDAIASSTQAFLTSQESEKNVSPDTDTSISDKADISILFGELTGDFYKKVVTLSKKKNTDSTLSHPHLGLKKVTALSILGDNATSTYEDLEAACGRCPRIEPVEEQSKPEPQNVTHLGQLLESYEITALNDPNLLVNQSDFEAFIGRYNFYETLEPNRMVQRLQRLYDTFNTTECTYFSPTDSLLIFGHNSTDFRGVYHHQEGGFITSPVGLRDFCIYVLPDLRKWIKSENAKYLEFLKRNHKKALEEEKRQDHKYKCSLVEKYHAMSEVEKAMFLDMGGHSEDGKTITASGKKKQEDKTKKLEERGGGEDFIVTQDDLEELPVRARMRPPEQTRFTGLNYRDLRTQVNVTSNEFYSDDGSAVSIRMHSWLYGNSLLTIIIRIQGSSLYFHRWMESGNVKKSFHLRHGTGIFVTFDDDIEGKVPLVCKITSPNGLIVQPSHKTDSPYIKQSYVTTYRLGEDIETEASRCYLSNGEIVVFRVDGTVDVLFPSGTKYKCRKFCKNEAQELHVELYEIMTTTGELWARDDCTECRHLLKTMRILIGADPKTLETFYRREDGTNCMLWPCGKLVTMFPDKTKITSVPEFDTDEIFIENEDGEDRKDGFTNVSCTYLMEHPKYASVHLKSDRAEVRMPGALRVEVSPNRTLKIESTRCVLKTTTETVSFYNPCRMCGRKSISTIYMSRVTQSGEILCVSKNYRGEELMILTSGEIRHKSRTENIKCEQDDEETLSTNVDLNLGGLSPCEHPKASFPPQSCLILERDLTGIEFINDTDLYQYIGKLSPDAYYHLDDFSSGSDHYQHGFFDPIYNIGPEKHLIEYECRNDGIPTRLSRKDLVPLRDFITPSSCLVTNRLDNWVEKTRNSNSDIPKVIVARFVRVLRPDPNSIMQEITDAVTLYQKTALNLAEIYRGHAKQGKQPPFTKYVAKELELIASTMCPGLDLYRHTCTVVPSTEVEIHTLGHRIQFNEELVKENADDVQTKELPPCREIVKPLRHHGMREDIPECPAHQ